MKPFSFTVFLAVVVVPPVASFLFLIFAIAYYL